MRYGILEDTEDLQPTRANSQLQLVSPDPEPNTPPLHSSPTRSRARSFGSPPESMQNAGCSFRVSVSRSPQHDLSRSPIITHFDTEVPSFYPSASFINHNERPTRLLGNPFLASDVSVIVYCRNPVRETQNDEHNDC